MKRYKFRATDQEHEVRLLNEATSLRRLNSQLFNAQLFKAQRSTAEAQLLAAQLLSSQKLIRDLNLQLKGSQRSNLES